jgi:hypothetical protein
MVYRLYNRSRQLRLSPPMLDCAGRSHRAFLDFPGGAVTAVLAAGGFPGIAAAAFLTNAVDTTTQSAAAGTGGADNAGIFPYNYISPFGFNGRAYFVRLGFAY